MQGQTNEIALKPAELAPGTSTLVTLCSLVGAAAALALPGPSGAAAAVASVLAVGALALLAGHAWGILVVFVADVLLVGHVWPSLAFAGLDSEGLATAVTALVAALPGVAMAGVALPAVVEVLLGEDRTDRARSFGMLTGSAAMVASLVLPAF